jgi:hypothetical protein
VAVLLVAGIFLGGAIDHAILALKRSPLSPYQLRVGVAGNWAFALVDLTVVACALRIALRTRPGTGKLGGKRLNAQGADSESHDGGIIASDVAW